MIPQQYELKLFMSMQWKAHIKTIIFKFLRII